MPRGVAGRLPAPGESRVEVAPGGPRRSFSLRAHLVGLVLVVLVPTLGIGAVAAWHLADAAGDTFRDRMADTVQALALATDRDLAALEAAALTLAASPTLRAGDFPAFRAMAAEVGAKVEAAVVVNRASPGFPQVLNTALPAGAPLPGSARPGGSELVARALATGGPVVSDLFEGRALGQRLVAVAAPVPGGELVLSLAVPAERLSRLIAAQGPSGGGIVLITDRQARIVAHSRVQERRAGSEAPATPAGTTEEAGFFEARAEDGAPALFAFRRLQEAPGWVLLMSEPLSAYQARLAPLLGLAAAGAAALGLGLGLAIALAERVGRPLSALLQRAEAVATGAPSGPLPPTPVAEFQRLGAALGRAHAALRDREAEFRAAFEQSAVPMSQVDCATGRLMRVNSAYCRLLGRDEAELLGRPFSDFVHPEDRDADLGGFRRMATGEAAVHEVEKRYICPDGSLRRVHLVSSAVCDASGRPARSVAILRDVTEQRVAEERQRLLAREVDHRAKNALSVMQAALRLTPRDDAESFARAVEGRVAALARAHTLLAEGRWTGAELRTLAQGELAPFLVPASAGAGAAPRAEISGPPFQLGPAAAQAFSMVLHELATNAAKHGALSAGGGLVALSWEADRAAGVLRLDWIERGGPTLGASPTRRGFGSRVIEATVQGQLGGRIERSWTGQGLVCRLEVPLERVAEA